MKLSISNIAWESHQDEIILPRLKDAGYCGLEIAPTRIISSNPYDQLEKAVQFKNDLKFRFNLDIPSIQSIWFGRTENLFQSAQEREALIAYTKKAIVFAQTLDCKNVVFGNPKSRNINNDATIKDQAIPFFKTLAEYAVLHDTVIALEANPDIYGTNFLNTTEETFNYVKMINSDGLKVNLDLGTMIHNKESLAIIKDNVKYINHIHISEPFLEPIIQRKRHLELFEILKSENYHNYISVEMKKSDTIDPLLHVIDYISKINL